MQSPYRAFGLRRNPFGELTAAERAELAVIDTQPLLEFLRVGEERRPARRVVQIYGGCGFGKTTHLLALQAAMPEATLIHFPESGPRPSLPRTATLLLVDEAQRTGWSNWRRLLAWRGPLVLATHVDRSGQLRRAGFEVRQLNAEARKSSADLVEILQRRIDASCLRPGDASRMRITRQLAERLLRQFDSNLRQIEHYLYEQLQHSLTERTPWPPVT